MTDWKIDKLGNYVEVQNGYAFKALDFSEEGVPVIKIKNIVSPRIVFEDVEYYNGPIDKKLNQYVIKTGDILISMTGSHLHQIASAVGKVGKYQFELPALLNQRVGKLYSKNKNLFDEGFLYYFISQLETQIDLVTSASGSANQANISPTQIKNLELKIPPINVQKEISSILSSLDERIELNLHMNQTLENLAQTIFNEWFANFNFPGFDGKLIDGIPGGWKRGRLDELFILQRGFDLPALQRTEGKYPVVAASGVSTYHDEYKILGPGVTTGRSGVLGNVYYINENFWPLNTSLFIKEYKASTPLYAYHLLKQIDLSQLNAGSAVPTLNRNDVHGLECLIPDIEIVKKFEYVTRDLFLKRYENQKQNQTLTRLRDSLLPKLINGKIEITA